MSVVVTGAAGHVGANLVRSLLTHKRPTRVLVHVRQQALDGLEIEVTRGDVRDITSLLHAFNGADVVYHLAADISLLPGERPQLEAVNANGTRNVVEACLRCGVRRLVYFSSIHAITQTPMDTPVDESRPLVESRQCPAYDRSKAAGEREILKGIERGMDTIIISPTGIIGPHDYEPSHFGDVILSLAQGRLPALVDGGFNWVDVRDVVEGALKAEEQARTGTKYILSGHWVSLCEVAALAEEITGVPAPRFVSPIWLAQIGAPFVTAFDRLTGRRPLFTSVSLKALRCNKNISHERATHELGYHPRPFTETLTDTLHWFAETGQLDRQVKTKSTRSQ